jgi:uncharacterized protein
VDHCTHKFAHSTCSTPDAPAAHPSNPPRSPFVVVDHPAQAFGAPLVNFITAPTRATKRRRLAASPAPATASAAAPPASPLTRTGAPLVVFAHGAGAGSSHAWMQGWRARLAARLRAPVHTFDFPYVAAGKKAPNNMPVLVAAFREAVLAARAAYPEAAEAGVLLAGKSMGSRAGLFLAEEHGEELGVVGCVAFGYPATGKDLERRRLPQRTKRPLMIVNGTMDIIAKIADVRAVVDGFCGRDGLLELVVVEGANHSLEANKTWLRKNGKSQEDVDAGIADAVAAWCERNFGEGQGPGLG